MRTLVITVHGIRTFGHWQKRLGTLLAAEGIESTHYRFGYFSVLAFMFPPLRWLVTRRFSKALTRIAANASDARIHIVAHSFGTHLVGWGLRRLPRNGRPGIDTVIFASSVLKPTFDWQPLMESADQSATVRRVVNDCATSDAVLLLNQLLVLFTGMAGRLGFTGLEEPNRFMNRFFRGGHSHYFLQNGRPYDDFMRDRWLPLLREPSEPIQDVDERQPTGPLSGLVQTILQNAEPIKLGVYAALLLVPSVVYASLYRQAEEAAAAAQAAQQATLRTNRDLRDTLVWVFNESARFDFDRFTPAGLTPEAQTLIAGTAGRLLKTGYAGAVLLVPQLARFCVDPQDPTRLAPPEMPTTHCGEMYSQEYLLALSDRVPFTLRDLLASQGYPPDRIKIFATGGEFGVRLFTPPGSTKTAGEWNRIARANNRVMLRLVDR